MYRTVVCRHVSPLVSIYLQDVKYVCGVWYIQNDPEGMWQTSVECSLS